jgi:hypothetical protein
MMAQFACFSGFSQSRRTAVAKGQQRGNREKKKPKAPKKLPPAAMSVFTQPQQQRGGKAK